MMEKRPLVWLAAASRDISLQNRLRANWSLTDFNLEAPVPVVTSVAGLAKVGVLDLTQLPGGDLHWLEHWLEALHPAYWVGIVNHRPVPGTRIAKVITRYCSDFHTLPVDHHQINTELGHLWGMAAMREPTESLGRDDYQSLILEGDSPAICHVRSLLRRFSATSEPILISGESGTGKEAAARFIHAHSPRANGPLVNINCASLHNTLTQSELFGHEKGAFTHALKTRQGRLEQANGGSLLLSGIDELRLDQQAAILRFLQEGQIERIGGSSPIPVECRIITSTCQSLPGLIAAGQFRSDVYFRLGGLEVKLPALKHRIEDIPALADSLLDAAQRGQKWKSLNAAAIQSLVNHSWPGNVRELQNRLRQGLLLSDQSVIEASDLGLGQTDPEGSDPSNLSLEEFRARADRQALSCSLKLAHQNVSKAARILKISRVSFYRLMERHNKTSQADRPGRRHYHKGDLQ